MSLLEMGQPVRLPPGASRARERGRAGRRRPLLLVRPQARAPNPARLLSSSELEGLAAKNGTRRTVYYTKKLPGEDVNAYARSQQYLGEWKDNQWEGKGTLEKVDGSRYVGEWLAGKRHGVGTLWQRQKDGSLRKVYSGHWEDDTMCGRGAPAHRAGRVRPPTAPARGALRSPPLASARLTSGRSRARAQAR
jgi:hypothetical protein